MVSALLLVVAFTVVGLGYNHLSVSNRLSNAAQARNLAEAALSKAIEELVVSNGAYGKDKDRTVVVNFKDRDNTAVNGVVTFEVAKAADYDIPLSTNNFASDNSTPAALGRECPGTAAHLVGVGECNGVRKTVEAVLRIPKFHTLGSSGTIESKGGMTVTAVNSIADIGDPDKQLKSRLAANGTGQSIKLEEPIPSGSPIKNNIHADITGRGTIDITTSNVTGEIRPNSTTPEALPDIDISAYDTNGKPGLTALTSDSGGTTPVKGFTRFNGGGTRTITYDKLTLDKGIFYVDGNLKVNQGVTGEGAIICTGSVEIEGGGTLSGDNRVALLSGGDVKITGDAAHPVVMKGMVYGEGNVDTNFTKLTGVLVSNKDAGGNQVEINNTTVTQVQDMGDFKVDGVGATTTGEVDSRSLHFPRSLDSAGFIYQSDVSNAMSNYDPAEPWKLGGADVKTEIYVPALNSNVMVDASFKLKEVDPDMRFKSGDEYALNYYKQNPWDPATGTTKPPGSYRNVPDANPYGYKVVPALGGVPDLTWTDLEVRVNGTVYAGNGGWSAAVKADYLAKAEQLAISQRGYGLNATERAQCQALADAVLDPSQPACQNMMLGDTGSVSSISVAIKAAEVPPSGPGMAPSPPATGGGATWEIHMNDFLNFNEEVEILYWREL